MRILAQSRPQDSLAHHEMAWYVGRYMVHYLYTPIWKLVLFLFFVFVPFVLMATRCAPHTDIRPMRAPIDRSSKVDRNGEILKDASVYVDVMASKGQQEMHHRRTGTRFVAIIRIAFHIADDI